MTISWSDYPRSILGLSSDYPRIVFILAEASQRVSAAILNFKDFVAGAVFAEVGG